MPDIKIAGIGKANPSANPLSGNGNVLHLQNMVSDIPGWAIKRRGIKQLNATSKFTSVFSSIPSTGSAASAWCFDDHLFVNAGGGGFSGIAAYSMVQTGGWHKVVEQSGDLRIDPSQYNIRPCITDRRLLLTTATGVKRLPAIYNDYYPKDSTTAVDYSTMYRNAGIPRGLDPRCPNAVAASASDPGLIASTGFEWLNPSSAVAYQVAWFKRDENAIPGIGVPSGRCHIRNTNTTTAYATRLKIPIPAGVTDSSYVLQIYRTFIVEADATGEIPDPGYEFFLAGEYRLTSTDLTNKYVLYEDVSFDPLLGEDLYTNETQDGTGQARFQPPVCRDIATFGGCTFFSNTTEKHRLTIKMLAVDPSGIGTYKGVRVGDKIVMGDLVMEGVAPASEETQVWYFAVDQTTGIGSEVIRAIKTSESLVYKYNLWSNANNGRYYAYNLTNNNDVVGVIGLEEKSIGGTVGAYVGVNRVDSPVQILPAPVFTSTPSQTLALACAVATNAGPTTVTVTTASAHNLTSNDLVFLAPFADSTDAGSSCPIFRNTTVPAGVYKVTVTAADAFTFAAPAGSAASQTDARAATTGGFVHKIFDVTTSIWTEARSNDNRKINRLMWSAFQEPECAPIDNATDIGAADRAIIRIVPTQDALFIFKEDGTWRLKGVAGDWEIVSLDKSCILAAPESPGVVDGRIFCYTTNGIVSVDDGGVMKISGPVGGLIDNFYRALLASEQGVMVSGVGHGEDQAYWICFGSSSGIVEAIWRYHCPTKSWSYHTFNDDATPGEGNSIYTFITTAKASRLTAFDTQAYTERLVVCFDSGTGLIGIERKTGRSNELCDIEIPATVLSFSVPNSTVTLSSVPAATEVGDEFIWYANSTYVPGNYETGSTLAKNRGVISAINGSVLTLSNTNNMSSWPAVGGGQSAAILKQIPARLVLCPIQIGSGFTPGHFSELEISLGSLANFSSMTCGFSSDVSYPSDATVSDTATSTISGYLILNSTLSNRHPGRLSLMRTFRSGVPREAVTGSSLIVSLEHNRAFEQFDVAGMRLIYNDGDNRVRRTNA